MSCAFNNSADKIITYLFFGGGGGLPTFFRQFLQDTLQHIILGRGELMQYIMTGAALPLKPRAITVFDPVLCWNELLQCNPVSLQDFFWWGGYMREIGTMWQIGVLAGKPCTFLVQNGSFSAVCHYKNKERLSRSLDVKWHIPSTCLDASRK